MDSLKTLIATKGCVIGTICALGSVDAAEVTCEAGFDFVVLDGQHGSFSVDSLREGVRAVQATGALPVARLRANDLTGVEALLDAGYSALIAPMVNTAAQAAALAASSYYPPLGVRSQASCRATLRWGSEYRADFNDDFSLLAMIEHADGVAEIDDILATPGITGVFIGPTDLASSLQSDTTRIAAAINRVRTAAAGKILGTAASDIGEAIALRDDGFQMITVSTDRRMLSQACRTVATGWNPVRKGSH